MRHWSGCSSKLNSATVTGLHCWGINNKDESTIKAEVWEYITRLIFKSPFWHYLSISLWSVSLSFFLVGLLNLSPDPLVNPFFDRQVHSLVQEYGLVYWQWVHWLLCVGVAKTERRGLAFRTQLQKSGVFMWPIYTASNSLWNCFKCTSTL